MEVNPEYLAEVVDFYPGARVFPEQGHLYLHVPGYKLPSDDVVEVLVLLTGTGSYPTRLYLPAQIPGKGSNWSQHHILGKTWWTWSWKDVPSGSRYIEILANHARALR